MLPEPNKGGAAIFSLACSPTRTWSNIMALSRACSKPAYNPNEQ